MDMYGFMWINMNSDDFFKFIFVRTAACKLQFAAVRLVVYGSARGSVRQCATVLQLAAVRQ
jgi:hypothetical protein